MDFSNKYSRETKKRSFRKYGISNIQRTALSKYPFSAFAGDEFSHEAAQPAAVLQPVGQAREQGMEPFFPIAWFELFSTPGTDQ